MLSAVQVRVSSEAVVVDVHAAEGLDDAAE